MRTYESRTMDFHGYEIHTILILGHFLGGKVGKWDQEMAIDRFKLLLAKCAPRLIVLALKIDQ